MTSHIQQRRLIIDFIGKHTQENVVTEIKMPQIVIDTLDVTIGIAGTVSLMLGSVGFGVLFGIFYDVYAIFWAPTSACLVAAIISRISIYCVNDNVAGIITCALTSAISISACIFTSVKMELIYRDVGSVITLAGVIIIIFTVIELGIVLIMWRKRLKNKIDIKHEILVEDGGSDVIGARYEYHQSPVANTSNATFHETPTTQRTASRNTRDRSRNKVNLWDDDVITTARIPKDKIIMENLISQGGYGEVYKGTFNGLSVAVKRMLPAHRKSVAHVNNFLAE
ncbi:hypothetical protein L917_01597, partial [Phytophthora nicotianae]